MKFLKLLLIILVIAAAIFGLKKASGKLSAARMQAVADVAPAEAAPWPVTTAPVRTADLRATYQTLGTVETISEITVSGQFAGTLTEVSFREGQSVQAGDVLARVDTTEFDAELDAKRAAIDAANDEAKRLADELGREEQLLTSGGSTQSAVDARSTAAVAAAKKRDALISELNALETRRGYSILRSPVDGVIAERLAEVGDLCAPFHPMYRITADGAARVSIRLPQSLLAKVHEGTPVLLESGPKRLEAKLTRIHPKLTQTALATVDIDLEEPPFALPSGARLDVSLLLCELEDATVVPANSLRTTESGASVLRVEDKRLTAVPVKVLFTGDDGVAVKGALSAGDALVIGRPERLAKLNGGDPVEVR